MIERTEERFGLKPERLAAGYSESRHEAKRDNSAPPRSPTQVQTAVPAPVQQLFALEPDLEKGELHE